MTSSQNIRPVALALLLSLGLASCKAAERLLELDFYDQPDSRIENLDRLHTARTGHHYTVAFVGDFEQGFGRKRQIIDGLTIGRSGALGGGESKPKALPNPSEACLELISELLDFDSENNPRLAALQVAWCARLIDEDPSYLSRERATLGLGPIARRIEIDGPISLPIDAPRADATQTADLLAQVIGAWRGVRDGAGSLAEFDAALQELQDTTFDLDGSRRVLVALAGLMGGLAPDQGGYERLLAGLEDFMERTIEFSLARALTERPGPASRLRAAAVSASVEAGGVKMLARFMSVLQEERRAGAERDALLVVRILDLIATHGFPESFAGLEGERFEEVLEGWYDVLIGFAVEDLEGRVRVKAMQALTHTVGGPASLRDEEWEDWYYARVEARRAKLGFPPTPPAATILEEPGS